MMTNRLFNSVFENSLRIILLLEAFQSSQTLDMLYVTDFMASYGATFGVAEKDLNGENSYKFSEFASRRELVRLALKQLALDGMVMPKNTERGIQYMITDVGQKYSRALKGEYASEYRQCAIRIAEKTYNKSERTLINEINKMSTKSLEKGSGE